MKLSLVVAMARNRVIGLDNKMPWHLSADLKYFKKITMGKPIIMGRKTCESIGRPLPGRRNIVISRNSKFRAEGFDVFSNFDTALRDCQEQPEVMVIGGAQLYETVLPRADCLYITYIEADYSGDTYFPEFDNKRWRQVKRVNIKDDETVSFSYSFVVFDKILLP